MADAPRTLREFMEQAARRHGDGKRPASGRQLGEIAHRHGWDIDRTTINHLLAGTYNSRPGRRTLDAIANLAGVTPRQVHEAAGRSYPETRFAEQLPPDVDELSPVQRRAVISVIRAMVNPEGKTQAARDGADDSVRRKRRAVRKSAITQAEDVEQDEDTHRAQ